MRSISSKNNIFDCTDRPEIFRESGLVGASRQCHKPVTKLNTTMSLLYVVFCVAFKRCCF